ncbi:MAG: signal peptidase I [Gammaproteobacteria bacterium]|nr:signal peptidase I [Gammaproteobacteria bacterium]
MSSWNFPLIMTIAVFVTGFIALLDKLFFAKKRIPELKPNFIIDYSNSLFPVLLIVLVIRSFIIQPFRVPTGSLEPTIIPGDFVAVNQFAYGLRLPVLNTKVVSIGEPKIGDIVVFRWPSDPSIDFIKRVVGVPGDHLVYQDKVLYINGKEATQTFVRDTVDIEPTGNIPVKEYEEDLNGVKHDILIDPNGGEMQDFDLVVPAGDYFMMGDNRDNSGDSREWGFVPEANLIGKGFLIWMSWDSDTHRPRWHRIGTVI